MDYDIEQGGPSLNPDALEEEADWKAPRIDNGVDVIDPARYYSKEFMDKEWETLWTRVWTVAGIASDIPEVGDYFTYDLLHESFIIVRVADGEDGIKGYYNVCGHRGNRLVQNEFGSVVDAFTCGFHSWSWSIDGSLKYIQDEESFHPDILSQAPDMVEVALDSVGGIIFINMDSNPQPLREFLGPVADHMESFQVGKMHAVRHTRSQWAANWKTGVDAFYENYHMHAVHPETQAVIDDIGSQYDCYPNGMSRSITPIGRPSPHLPDSTTVNDGLQGMLSDAGIQPKGFEGDAQQVRPAIWDAKREFAKKFGLDYEKLSDVQLTDSFVTGIFPYTQFGMHPEGAFLMRFLPHPDDPQIFTYDNITLVRYVNDPNFKVPGWMGLPEGTDYTGKDRPDIEYKALDEPPELGLVLDQDAHLLPTVQKGIRSRAFQGPLWCEQEQRLRHFHKELDRYLDGGK